MMSTPAPGTAAYFPSVLARIHEACPELPVDPVILQSLLLCLVANDEGSNSRIPSLNGKNLILRTRDEDIGLVLNLTELILTRVFGFPTHKRKLKHHSEVSVQSGEVPTRTQELPDTFLRTLFFRRRSNQRWSTGMRRPGSGRGTMRTSSFPTVNAENAPPPSSTSHSREGTEDSEFDVTSLGSSRRLFVTPASTLRIKPQAQRTETEPPPDAATAISQLLSVPRQSPKPQPRKSDFISNVMSLPKALIFSGLENTGIPAQRALLQTLHERRLELDAYESDDGVGRTWALPEDFVVVYVCSTDPHGRPPVLATLLDRFAMSVDITVSPAVRQAYTSYRSSSTTPLSASYLSITPRTPSSPLRPFDGNDGTTTSSPLLRATSQAATSSSSAQQVVPPVISPHEITYLRSLTTQAPPAIPPAHQLAESDPLPDAYTAIHPSLGLYLADLFSATRHHPLLDGTMLTLRAHRDAEDLARAFRVISGSSIGAELVVEVATMVEDGEGEGSLEADADTHDGLLTPDDESSLEWGKTTSPEVAREVWLDEELRIGRRKASSVRSLEVRVQDPEGMHGHEHGHGDAAAPFMEAASSINLRTGLTPPLVRPPQIWDVSEVDIAKVFPRVVSHRVRLRRGPDDEILGSVMYPAVPVVKPFANDDSEAEHSEEQSVKQVLISILADV